MVCTPFAGVAWCVQRLCVNAPSGRQRVTVLAAVHASTHERVTVQHLTDSTAETVGAWWCLLAGSWPGLPMTVVLENARDQRCAVVPSVAPHLHLEW